MAVGGWGMGGGAPDPRTVYDVLRMRRLLTLAALAGCSWALGHPAARVEAQGDSRQSAAVRFSERQPGTFGALSIDIDYVNPSDPGGKPPAVRNIVVQLADGTRVDTTVPRRCAASDAQLMAQGPGACPADSLVGEGFVRIDTGLPGDARFLEEDLTLLNAANQLIFLFRDRRSGTRLSSRAAVEGGTLTTSAPPLPGAPPDGGAIDVVIERLNAIPGNSPGRGYVVTPASCPSSGTWTNSIRFTYADGVTQSVQTQSPCRPGGKLGGQKQRDRCNQLWKGTRASDRRFGGPGRDRLRGFAGNDLLGGRRAGDCLYGDRGNDRLRGSKGHDRLFGGAGADHLRGGPNPDLLRGGSGPDTILARGGGADRIRCGGGKDKVNAGPADSLSQSC